MEVVVKLGVEVLEICEVESEVVEVVIIWSFSVANEDPERPNRLYTALHGLVQPVAREGAERAPSRLAAALWLADGVPDGATVAHWRKACSTRTFSVFVF